MTSTARIPPREDVGRETGFESPSENVNPRPFDIARFIATLTLLSQAAARRR